MSDQITKEISQEKQDVIDDLLKDLPEQGSVVLDFPSHGKFYQPLDAGKPITLRPLNFEDEKAIVAQKNSDPVDLILSRCLENLNAASLISIDKAFVLVKLREISYGKDYDALITCPSCGKKGEVAIDLSDLKINYLPEDIEDPREITLPNLKKKVTVKFPRSKDEKYLKTPELAASQIWRFIIAIEDHTDRQIISEVLKKLPLVDVHYIINSINMNDYGVDPRFMYGCPECKAENLMGVPLGSDFFSVSLPKS